MLFAGVDGCKSQWFAVLLKGAGEWELGIFNTIAAVWANCSKADLILIDIPIGLQDGAARRICDIEAKNILGKRQSSIFFAPCREVLKAKNYEEANIISKQTTGHGLSVQTWGIVPKIKQVDEFLLNESSARLIIRECHPEICFYYTNRRNNLTFSKLKPEGLEERKTILRKVYPSTDKLVSEALTIDNSRPKVLAENDILDALVAAITASHLRRVLSTIPETPEYDSKGLPIEMVYYRF